MVIAPDAGRMAYGADQGERPGKGGEAVMPGGGIVITDDDEGDGRPLLRALARAPVHGILSKENAGVIKKSNPRRMEDANWQVT